MAGMMAKRILSGEHIFTIQPKILDELTLFVNQQRFAAQKILTMDHLKSINLPLVSLAEKNSDVASAL